MATKKAEIDTPKASEKAPVTLKEIKIIKKTEAEPIAPPTEEELAELSKVAHIIDTPAEEAAQEEDDDSLKIPSEFDENGFEFKRIKLSRPCKIPSRGEALVDEVTIKAPSLEFLINNPMILEAEFVNNMIAGKITPETLKMAFRSVGLEDEDYAFIPLMDGMVIVKAFLTFLGK